MKANEYRLLDRCVEDGIQIGLNHAYKHCDTPSLALMKEKIQEAVMLEISEWFEINEVKHDIAV